MTKDKNIKTKKGMVIMTENKIEVFTNKEFGSVRTMVIDDEVWFVGKDVTTILGYGDGNSNSKSLANAIKDHVDDDDKCLLSYSEYRNLKGYQNGDLKNISHYGIIIINESGLYSLIFSSKLPTAKKFKHWVTAEVLPTIRKTGGYIQSGSEMELAITSLQQQVVRLAQKLMEKPIPNEIAINIWKKDIATPIAKKIAEVTGCEMKMAYRMIYEKMLVCYGFSYRMAITEFSNKYHLENSNLEPTTINAVADNQIYQQEFVQAGNMILQNYWYDNSSVKSNDSHSDETENAEQIPKIVQNKFTVHNSFDEIVSTLAETLGDKSCHYNRTLGLVYQRMNSDKGWKNLMTRNKTKIKKNIVLKNANQFKKFVQASNEIYNEKI